MHIAYPNIILDGLENGVIILNEDLTVYYWNLWMEINTRVKANNIMKNNLQDYFHDINYVVLLRKIRTSLRLNSATFYSGFGSKNFMIINRHKVTSSSVNIMQLKVTITPYLIEEKKVMISIYDVSEMQEVRFSLQREIEKSKMINKLLEQDKKIIDHNLMILKMDYECKIVESSRAFCDFFQITKEELVGKTQIELCNISTMPSLQNDILKVIINKKTWRGEIQSHDINGKARWLDAIITPFIDTNNEIINITAIYHDISDQKRIEELSITDPLTRLYNRQRFNDLLDELIVNNRKTDKGISIIFMDIDYFKNINDTYGHPAGDSVLVKIAKILKDSTRKSDFVARWGGEEFVIILPEMDINISEKLAQIIRKNIETHLFDAVGKVTCSFGVTQYINGDTKEKMFFRVDKALYQAKDSGRNKVVVSL